MAIVDGFAELYVNNSSISGGTRSSCKNCKGSLEEQTWIVGVLVTPSVW